MSTKQASLSSEMAIVGQMARAADYRVEMLARLSDEHFHHPTARAAFTAMRALDEEHAPVSVRTILDRMPGDNDTAWWTATFDGDAAPPIAEAFYNLETFRRRRVASECSQAIGTYASKGHDALMIESVQRLARQMDSPIVPADRYPSAWLDDLMEEPLPEYDWIIKGLIAGRERVVFVGAEAGGKALDTTTPVLTEQGWTTIGDVVVGDRVFGPDGKPTAVIACSPVEHNRPCYRVRFSDGAEIVADAGHLWSTVGYDDRQRGKWLAGVHTTEEIGRTVRARDGHVVNHAIACAAPPELPDAVLPVDPYTLGAWLGDGDTNGGGFTSADHEIIERIRAAGWDVKRRQTAPYRWYIGKNSERAPFIDRRSAHDPHALARTPYGKSTRAMSLMGRLRVLGVLGNKRIPAAYLTASAHQRLELLRGLLDTDGSIYKSGKIEISQCNELLAIDILHLAWSLGLKATINENDAKLNGRVVGKRWRIQFRTSEPVFALQRKASRVGPLRTRTGTTRYIVAVEPAETRPVRCLVVDRSDGLFVVGERLITTHNSTILRQIAVRSAMGWHPWAEERIEPVRVIYVDLENSRVEVRREINRMYEALRSTVDFKPKMRMAWATGFDMERALDRSWLIDLADEVEPRLIVFGPLYKAVSGRNGWGKQSEEIASILTEHIDLLAARYEAGVILEGHAPHKAPGEQRREWRVRGSAAYQGWANFVLGFQDVYLDPGIDRERRHTLVGGKKRDAVRQLPACIVRGPAAMPWMPCMIPGGCEEGHDDNDVRKWL